MKQYIECDRLYSFLPFFRRFHKGQFPFKRKGKRLRNCILPSLRCCVDTARCIITINHRFEWSQQPLNDAVAL